MAGLEDDRSVVDCAREALLTAAVFYDSAGSPDPAGRRALAARAEDCRQAAFALDDPGEPTLARLARTHLEAAASLMEATEVPDALSRERLNGTAGLLRQVAELAWLAPAGRVGPRLGVLLPYLRKAANLPDGPEAVRFPPLLVDSVTTNPEFWSLAQDAYQAANGQPLESLEPTPQWTWVCKLIPHWLATHDRVRPLSRAELVQIDHAVAHPNGGWIRPPLMAGNWTELAPEDAAAVLRLAGERLWSGRPGAPLPIAHQCDRVRTTALACLGGVMLAEVQGRVAGRTGIATLLISEQTLAIADGGSSWIFDLTEAFGAGLDTEQTRIDYLRMFMNLVRVGEGRFQTVETPESLDDRAVASTAIEACRRHASPLEPAGIDSEGRWLFSAVVCHGAGLFRALVALGRDGYMDMVQDDPLEFDLPIRQEQLEDLFVVLEPPPAEGRP